MNLNKTFVNPIIEDQSEIFISQYKEAENRGRRKASESFLELKKKFEESSETDSKTVFLLSEIILLKKAINELYTDEFYQIIHRAKEYASNSKIDISKKDDEITNLFSYTLNFYRFQNTPDSTILKNLLLISIKISDMYKAQSLITKFEYFFKKLNAICKIDSFNWDWSNFESGLIKFQFNQFLDKLSYKNQHEAEIYKIKKQHEAEIDNISVNASSKVEKLESRIIDLNHQINNLNDTVEYMKNYFDKYYYRTQTIISDTYFGDNQPFLLNLYNFLKINNLFPYGWSYFYNCLVEGNHEIIPLETTERNIKPIGRIFYHLKDLLIKHYKDEPEKFIRSKFHINNQPLGIAFFRNHVYSKPDKDIQIAIREIDRFFEKQNETFLKNTI